MEINIVMNQTEFIISTLFGPLLFGSYYLLKLYFLKHKNQWVKAEKNIKKSKIEK